MDTLRFGTVVLVCGPSGSITLRINVVTCHSGVAFRILDYCLIY